METTKRNPLYAALAALLALSVLLRFLVLLYPNTHMLQSHFFGLVPVMLAVPVLAVPAVRRQRGFRLSMLLTAWTVVSCLCASYVESDLYTVLTSYFLTLVFLFCICYPLAFALPTSDVRRLFRLVAALFLLGMTALGAVAVYAALMNVTVPSPAGTGYRGAGIVDQRLAMFSSSVATGSYTGIALFLGLLLLSGKPKKPLAALYILCLPVVYAAMALSDSRIPIVCTSVIIGGLVWLLASERLPIPRLLPRMLASFAVAGALIGVLYFGTGYCITGANALASSISANRPDASDAAQIAAATETPDAAAEADEQALSKRPLLYRISSLNGRTDVWMSAVDMFRNEPIKLLTGTSPVFVIADTQPYLSPNALNKVYPHMHSLPFQTVTALGVPGLVLYAILILYICAHALRVFFCGSGACSLFERGVALIPLFYAVMDVADVSLWFAPPSSFTPMLFYLAGGYAVYLSTTRLPRTKRANKKAAVGGGEANA